MDSAARVAHADSVKRETACNRDCPDACGLLVTVEGGRVVRVEGSRDHPVTRGFLCRRTSRFHERHHSRDRLTRPLIRRGDGELAPASWDEAFDRITAKLLAVREESGPAAILHYRSGGSLGLLKHVTDYFFERFGPVTIKSGDICSGAGDWAQETDFGDEDSNDLFDLLNSRNVVLWGKNPYVSNVHLLPVLREARSRGARLWLVDPVHHRTAGICDGHVQPRPGGDLALALGTARQLFERGLADPEAASYCDHLGDFEELTRSRSLGDWASLSGVDAGDVERLAEIVADRPTALVLGWGMQRRSRGAATVRALDALGAVSGNVGIAGGGVSYYFKRRGAFDLSFLRGAAAAPRTIPEPLLGPGILEAADPEVRVVWVTCGNPVAMLPESRTVERALATREMTVVVDAFLTDTARVADVVLPTTTMLEDDDLVGAYGHHWLSEVRPVIPPHEGAKTDLHIVRELARRTGLADEIDHDADWWKRRLLSRVAGRGAALEDLRRGPVKNPEAPQVLFEGRRFPTSSGRVNLLRHADPEPPATTLERPLLLMALSTDRAQSSQWAAGDQQGLAEATVHPDAAPGLAAGDRARIESDLGGLDVVLRLDPRQRRDVVLVDKGGWLSAGRCANALIRARATDHGGGAAYHDTAVSLRWADDGAGRTPRGDVG